MTTFAHVSDRVGELAKAFQGTRGERLQRVRLDPDDFAALADTGRSRADYDDFSIRLQTEQALRDAVRFTHQQTCMG